MAWQSKEMAVGSSSKGLTGESQSRSALSRGLSKTTSSKSVVRATSRKNSESQTRQFSLGFAFTRSKGGAFQRQERQSIGVRLAPTTRCGIAVANLTRIGLAASPLIGKTFTQVVSGSRHARRFGNATRQLADGVSCEKLIPQTCRSTFITLSLLPSSNCVPTSTTSYCSAKSATTSFILKGM